jgi:hypothetical protein
MTAVFGLDQHCRSAWAPMAQQEPDRDVATEADVVDPVAETEWLSAEELEELAADAEYLEEVVSCCAGRDWTCGHYGVYVEPRRHVWWSHTFGGDDTDERL